ncbi:MAG: hypothetical protein RKP46_09430 [Candidatus Accumulibacter sp.]|uniref:hypothetical protein n=1 Tax=Accumulibacter sp. TaxID=2053492 RepID=UPI0028792A93|nr:hypothetical protein [Accumulibacter sp.]MDS4014563.1 hypothetical protein [Accumulibacter sp.]
MEDTISDSQALPGFVRIDLSREAVQGATTLLQFRHLLEVMELSKAVCAAISAQLTAKGLMMRAGAFAEVTILAARASVKGTRDQARCLSRSGIRRIASARFFYCLLLHVLSSGCKRIRQGSLRVSVATKTQLAGARKAVSVPGPDPSSLVRISPSVSFAFRALISDPVRATTGLAQRLLSSFVGQG